MNDGLAGRQSLHDFLVEHEHGKEIDSNALREVLVGNKASVKGLTKLLSILRNEEVIHLSSHLFILEMLKTTILLDSPPSIQFPGDSKSYVQLPSINLAGCQEAFTLSLWMRLEDGGSVKMKSSLFRCRSPQGGVECTLSEHHADGRCRITMQVYSDSSRNGHQNEQINGSIFLSSNTWHLVSFFQIAQYGTPMFKCYVDGNLEMEHELAYPFHQSPPESLWSFGAGLRGQIASIVLYGGSGVPHHLVRLHAEAGPLMPSLDTSVTHPQGSFDSGHCLLGTQLTKGHDALRASHSSPLFVFTAKHFSPHSLLPYSYVGRVNVEHVEMITSFHLQEPEIDKVPFIAGACSVTTDLCWIQVWGHIGGTSVLLYLIWSYAQQSRGLGEQQQQQQQDCFACIHQTMELLEMLLFSSADARDLFLQEHGFHLLAYSLARVGSFPPSFVNRDLVDRCFSLVQGLRSDSVIGDGLTAAIQGLLLNFKLWGCADTVTKIHLLNRVSAFMGPGGGGSSATSQVEVLHHSFGVQRLLDIMKEYCVISPSSTMDGSGREKARELMDAAHRLLVLAMNAALQVLPPLRGHRAALFPELCCVLRLLEETSSCELAERLLRLVSDIRCSHPHILAHALQQMRFNETVALHLLCNQRVSFSMEVRRSALVTVLWSFSELVKDIPTQLLGLRQCFRLLHGKGQQGKEASGMLYSGDLAACVTVKQLMKTIEKIWVNVNMLCAELKVSLSPTGQWLVLPSTNHDPLSSPVVQEGGGDVSELLDLALFDGPLGFLSPLLIVPLLSTLLPKVQQRATKMQGGGGLEACQRALMSLSVVLKTNEAQTCLLSLLPDISWMKHLLTLAMVGEEHRRHLQSFVLVDHGDGQGYGNTGDTSGTNGSGGKSDCDLASTCTELALDSLAQVVVFKVCHHGRVAWDSILIVQSLLRTRPFQAFELSLSRRLCTLCVQKLSRLSLQLWPSDALVTIANLIVLIEENEYCGNELVIHRKQDVYAMRSAMANAVPTARQDQSVDLLGLDSLDPDDQVHEEQCVYQSEEERQLLFFLFDFSASLRRAGEKQGASPGEVALLLPVLRILSGCLCRARDDTGDRMCVELLATVSYMAEHWLFFPGEGLRRVVSEILSQLQGALQCLRQREKRRGTGGEESVLLKRYSDLVVTIAQFFVQLRFVYAEGEGLPAHVVSTVESLSMVEGCNDANTILSVMNIPPLQPHGGSTGAASVWETGGQGFSSGSSSSVISFTDEDDDLVTVAVSTPPSHLPAGGEDKSKQEQEQEGAHEHSHRHSHTEEHTRHSDHHRHRHVHLPHPSASSSLLLEQLRDTHSSGSSRHHHRHHHNFHLDAIEHEEELHRKYLAKWLQVRRGISLERVDTEQARFLRALEGACFSEEATARFWRLLARKLEAELFGQKHACEWKLGVAHEGYFPSRKRLVLRPRFLSQATGKLRQKHANTAKMEPIEEGGGDVAAITHCDNDPPDAMRLARSMSAAELQAVLSASTQQPGVLVDVHQRQEEEEENEGVEGRGKEVAGSGFCVVGADDSEDGGFGVVGLAGVGKDGDKGTSNNVTVQGERKPPRSSSDDQEEGQDEQSAAVDDVGDMDVNTGPCHSGTRRFVGKHAATDLHSATVHEADVVLISASGNHVGHMTFTEREIYFVSTPTAHLSWEGHTHGSSADVAADHLEDVAAVTLEAGRKTRRRKWSVSAISAIYLRRYRHRDSSIEVFFGRGKHRNFFVDFGSSEEDGQRRNEFVKILMEVAPQSALKEWPGMSIHRLLNETGVQQRWLEGELSNFDYLMALNTLAGRSYNDLCQYPVFPWVLSQYTEPTVDLQDPANFRDLSKPVGALNEERFEQFLDRFESFRDSDMPPFMYGSHYSTMVGVVLHFLVRLQPFASLHKKMQGGSFDVADRLFSSIPRTWEHNTTMLSEVKELTPEFFCLPDFLRNCNHYDLGRTQTQEAVQDVELPPWATSPEDFIRINRAALESDYVSAHLHEWIDLIFGYKQRGPRAVEAGNVFYYLTYYGAVNRSLIADEATKKAIELQIAHFGQCPMEIFRYPHPPKTKVAVPRPLHRCFAPFPENIPLMDQQQGRWPSFALPSCPEEELCTAASCTLVNRLSSAKIVDLLLRPGSIVCILDNGVLEAYRFAMSDTAKFIISNRKKDGNREASSGGSGSQSSGGGGDGGGGVLEDGGLGNLISFEDFDPPFSHSQEGGSDGVQVLSLVEELEGRDSSSDHYAVSMVDTPPPKQKSSFLSQRRASLLNSSSSSSNSSGGGDCYRDVLIAVEKELLHLDQVQRVPLTRSRRNRVTPSAAASTEGPGPGRVGAMASPQVHCSQSSGLVFCYGRIDGGVAVRQLASKHAQVLLGGDFRGHLYPVCGLASDEVTGGSTDVVCSCDVGGKVLVWTVSSVTSHSNRRASSSQQGGSGSSSDKKCIISRRPQRQFQCTETPHMGCDLSWALGVVAASHDAHVSVFSIERNERLASFEVLANDLWPSADAEEKKEAEILIHRIKLSDDGFILLALTVQQEQCQKGEAAAAQLQHVLATFTLRGHCVRSSQKISSSRFASVGDNGGGGDVGNSSSTTVLVTSPITFLSVPGRGSVALSGHQDGTVMFFDARNLQLLHQFRPHEHSLTCIFSSTTASSSSSSSGTGGVDRRGVVSPSPEQAPVLAARVGPNPAFPAVLCVTTSGPSGGFYVCALPDFSKWDRVRSQSALSQLVHVPMAVVRGSLQQAQNLTLLATDGAGQLAQNAKSYADDALAKINKSKLVKNVFGMFGSGNK